MPPEQEKIAVSDAPQAPRAEPGLSVAAALAAADARARVAEAERDALLASTSWWVTWPLRAIGRRIGLGRTPLPAPATTPSAEAATAEPATGTPDALLDDTPLNPASLESGAVLPKEVTDRAGAMRWVLHTFADPGLRARFPTALHDGPEGPFAAWIMKEAERVGVPAAGLDAIPALLAGDPAVAVRDLFLRSEEHRSRFPLGLLPSVRGGYARTLMAAPGTFGLLPQEVGWFVLHANEWPAEALAVTYFFTRDWQRRFPDGLTVFGWPAFARWLREVYALPDVVLPEVPPVRLPAAEALRLAYHARPAWRLRHPAAMARAEAARDLLHWLADMPDLGQAARAWCTARLADGTADAAVAPGLNVVGHFRYPSGLRRSIEALCSGVEAAGLPITRRDMRTDPADEAGRAAFAGLEVHDVTLLHVQPEPFFPRAYERADLTERRPRTYRVGYWYWETDTAPPIWADIADAVDEVWTATEFVAAALRRTVSVPVFTFPPGVVMPAFEARQREHFGLPPARLGRFAFLFAFHLSSVMERKNPFGLINAFRAAFAPDEPVDLILKVTSFGRHAAELRTLREASAGLNIHLLDTVLSTEDTLALIAACDAYVSLHRSEGLGLTMAEAMLLGRPVIASRTSGNLDFMDDANSLLVDGTLVPVGPGNPPYDPASLWFDASIEDAARQLRRLYEDRAFAAELGARARRSASARLSPSLAGQRIAARVRDIAEMRRRGILS